MIKHIVLFFFGGISAISYAQILKKTMKHLPGTGQVKSYTTTVGEDADFNIDPPVFKINTDKTVYDTVTGLMWQQSDGGEMTVENAIIYCDTLTLAGYTDWRLPNCHEMLSILNHDRVNPAIDTNVFKKTRAEYWWGSQRQANDVSKVWCSNAGGGVGNHPKTETLSAGGTKRFHVRAVRDVVSVTKMDHFSDNANGTVTDQITGRIWQKAPCADSLNWEDALKYADTLTLAGFADWRLPDIKEMQSINDELYISPSVNTTYFPAIGVRKFWSGTSLPNQTTRAWYLSTQFGITTYDSKIRRNAVLCVRGGTDLNAGIKTADRKAYVFYPNPVQRFIVLPKELNNKMVSLYNSAGKLILYCAQEQVCDLGNLQSGLYYLIYDDRDILPLQFIKTE